MSADFDGRATSQVRNVMEVFEDETHRVRGLRNSTVLIVSEHQADLARLRGLLSETTVRAFANVDSLLAALIEKDPETKAIVVLDTRTPSSLQLGSSAWVRLLSSTERAIIWGDALQLTLTAAQREFTEGRLEFSGAVEPEVLAQWLRAVAPN